LSCRNNNIRDNTEASTFACVSDLKKLDDGKLQKIQDIVNCAHVSEELDNKKQNNTTPHKKFSKVMYHQCIIIKNVGYYMA